MPKNMNNQTTMKIDATKSMSKPSSSMAMNNTKSPINDVNASLPNLLLLVSSAFLFLLASKIL